MNSVNLVGRLTKDIDIKTSGETVVGRFTLAVDRPLKKDEADFISVVCFGKTAEVVEKYTGKGSLVGVTGRIQTGSYENKDKVKVYTTDVIADRVEFLGSSAAKSAPSEKPAENSDVPAGFNKLTDDDIPF